MFMYLGHITTTSWSGEAANGNVESVSSSILSPPPRPSFYPPAGPSWQVEKFSSLQSDAYNQCLSRLLSRQDSFTVVNQYHGLLEIMNSQRNMSLILNEESKPR